MSPRRCAACTAATGRRRAARAAATLAHDPARGCGRRAPQRPAFPASAARDESARDGGAESADGVRRRRRDDPGRYDEQRADHHGARAVYNNLRAVIEQLDTRRAQVFVEALIVEVPSDKAAEFGIQWQVLTGANRNRTRRAGLRRHQLRRARQRQQHHRRVGQSRLARPGPQPRRHQRHDHHSRPRHHQQPGLLVARARERHQREHPVDADAADARQRGGADHRRPERAVHHRPVRDDRHDGDRARRSRRSSARTSASRCA